jgi:hypothetical protein
MNIQHKKQKLKCMTKDIIAHHLLPLLDDLGAMQFILASHETYNQYYINYKIKRTIRT